PALEALEQRALAQRPELASLRAQIEGSKAAVARAEREYLPDFGVMAAWDSMFMGAHRAMVGVTLNLPLQLSRRAAAVDEAESLLRRADAEQRQTINEIRSEVEQARRRLEESFEVMRLYRDRLLPATKA